MAHVAENRFHEGQRVRADDLPFDLRIVLIYVQSEDVPGTSVRRGELIASCVPDEAPWDNRRGFPLRDLTPVEGE